MPPPVVVVLLLALFPAGVKTWGGWFGRTLSRDRVDAGCPDAVACEDTAHLLRAHIDMIESVGGDGMHEMLLERFDRNGDRAVDIEEARRHGIGAVHFAYYDTSPIDRILDYSEWMRCARELPQYASADLAAPTPAGHLQPLGQHGTPAPLGELVDVLEFKAGTAPPHPREFWRNQVETHRPALLHGAANFSPAATLWSEDYLVERFGEVAVKVEPAQEDRGSDLAYRRLHAYVPDNGRMSLRELLELPTEAAAYAVSILPQSMAWDVAVPPTVLCGGRHRRLPKRGSPELGKGYRVPHPYPHSRAPWMTHLLENNLWVGRGRTRSQLHFDKENIVNCLFHGEKRWTLIDTRAHATDMSWVRGGRYNTTDDFLNAGTDWVAVDTQQVDLRMFPGLARAKFTTFTQHAGDCIFVPYSMLHAVEKVDDELGVAVSYMWQPMEEYDDDACAAIELNLQAPSVLRSSSSGGSGGDTGASQDTSGSWLSLGAMDVLWHYNGQGVIPQGYLDPAEELLPDLLQTRHNLHLETQKEHVSSTKADRNADNRAQRFELVTLEVLEYWSDGSRITLPRLQKIWRDIMVSAAATATAQSQPLPHEQGLTTAQIWWPEHSSKGLVPLRLWMVFAVEGDPEGMLGCDIGFQYNCRSLEEEEAIALAATTWRDTAVLAAQNTNAAAAAGVRDRRQGADAGGKPSALRGDIASEILWYDEAFATVVPMYSLVDGGKMASSGVKAFEIRTDGDSRLGEQHNLRVLVIDSDTPSWVPSGGVGACDGGWEEMSAAKGLETNSYSCHFSQSVATNMLRIFLRATLPALRSAFGVTRCEHRDIDSVGLSRKAFTTLLSRDLARDDLHADGCDAQSLDGGEYFTVLGYPHTTWDSSWGGHTEFAARRCGDKETQDAKLAARTPAVLRVAPLPNRTVVFEGQVLHRATWPSASFVNEVAVDGAGEGERGSTVMQLVCWRDRELMTPTPAGGHEDL